MTAARSYVVTAPEGRQYGVELAASGEGWNAVVERDGRRWSFAIEPGPEGLVRVGQSPHRWHWDAAVGVLVLDGIEHTLRVETEAEHRVFASAGDGRVASSVQEIRAPMPGLILAVEVAEDQEVARGQGLLVIEAMKMENEITAPVSGVVRAIGVGAGQAVERGALLCRIEPPAEVGT